MKITAASVAPGLTFTVARRRPKRYVALAGTPRLRQN